MIVVALANLVKFVTSEPEQYEMHKPYYVLCANGVYRHTMKDAILVKEIYSGLDKDLPILPQGEEGFFYQLPKIPFAIYLRILDFYKAVHAQSGTEASCHLFYLGDDKLQIPDEFEKYKVGILHLGEWLLYCPQQTNSGTLTSFREDALYPYLRKQYRLAIETHSHHTMGAFWSGTDNANQKDPVLYGVFGQINVKDDFLVKYVHQGENITIPSTEIVDYPRIVQSVDAEFSDVVDTAPTTHVYSGPFKTRNEFPSEWLTECHKTGRGFGSNSSQDPEIWGSSYARVGASTGRMQSNEPNVSAHPKSDPNIRGTQTPSEPTEKDTFGNEGHFQMGSLNPSHAQSHPKSDPNISGTQATSEPTEKDMGETPREGRASFFQGSPLRKEDLKNSEKEKTEKKDKHQFYS